MPISASVTNQQITASVGETQIDVAVSGGFGPSGAAATITVGTVTTGAAGSSATVTNVGTQSAAVLNFVIPAGATGVQGIQGAKGDTGDVGPAGAKGDRGDAGAQGQKGDAGDVGPAGAKGDRGDAGAQGPAGVAGAQGQKGDAGDVGPAGAKGDRGDAGAQGPAGAKGDRGDAGAQGPAGATGPAGTTSWNGITDKPATFSPSAHTHTASAITDFSSAVDAKLTTQTAQVSFADITMYDGVGTGAGMVLRYQRIDGIQSLNFSDNTTQTSAWTGSVAISGVTGLQTALDGKAASNHTHTSTAITNAVGSPTVLSASQDNYTLPAADIVRLAASAAIDITGFVATSGGDARLLVNVGANTITLRSDSASSTAANRLRAASGDFSLVAGGSVAVIYDGTDSVWRVAAAALSASDITSGTIAAARLPTVLERGVTVGNSGTSTTLSLANGSVQTVTLTGNCTFTMPAAAAGASLTLILTQSGTFTATFSSVLWAGGTAPTITATNTKRDILVFVSDGTSWFGTAAQNF